MRTIMSEQWLPVIGYGGLYEVSSEGMVRSVERVQQFRDGRVFHFRSRVLRPAPSSNGHLSVVLCRDSEQSTAFVHVLVAEAFLPNPEGHPVVRHWDDNPTDNRVENLRWGTYSQNSFDAVRNGRNHNANKTHCIRGHEFTPQNTLEAKDGGRRCRECARIRLRAFRARKQSGRAELA